jgi:hypothetical protein
MELWDAFLIMKVDVRLLLQEIQALVEGDLVVEGDVVGM